VAEIVVDSNVWVGYWLRRQEQYPAASALVQELQQGLQKCHIPRLVIVEVCSTILREVERPSLASALLLHIKETFAEWEVSGSIKLYDLNEERANSAIDMNSRLTRHLKGSDSIIAALAQELNLPLKTFDIEIQQRYPNATT